MSESVGPDLRCNVWATDERIVRWNPVSAGAVSAERVDTDDCGLWNGERLAVVTRVMCGTSVAQSNVEHAVVRRAGLGVWVERDRTDVVVRGELANPEDLA